MLPPDALVGGKTQAEWSAAWWIWQWTTPTNQHPLFDATGAWAGVNQPDAEVFFLAGVSTVSGTNARSVTVPEGKYLFLPVINAYCDNVDVFPPMTTEELLVCAAAQVNATTELHARLDGVVVTNLVAYRQISPVFSFVHDTAENFESWVAGHPVVGLVDPAVADGFWLMIEPLSPGTHVIKFGGSSGAQFQFAIDTTDTITVVPMPLSKRVQELISSVTASNLPGKRTRPLLRTLQGAAKSFDRGHARSGIRHLRAFQKKVRHEITRIDPALADQFIAAAQRIIDRAEQDAAKLHSHRRGDGTS